MKLLRIILILVLLLSTLMLAGCSGSVGVGMSVGVPVGSNGYVRVGGSTGRWY
jgi:predicted small secreted protein